MTVRLPGRTLAERLDARGADAPAPIPWAGVGRCIARFHARGVRHADLNAHNVLLDGDDVHLIDFDRATRRRVPAGGAPARWQRDNVARLRRSLRKLAARAGRAFDAEGFARLERAWRDALGPRPGARGPAAPAA